MFLPNYYDILNVPVKADHDTVYRLFRETVRRCHPDSGQKPPFDFTLISEGFKILRDPLLRQAYDRALQAEYPDFFRFSAQEVPSRTQPLAASHQVKQIAHDPATISPHMVIRGQFTSDKDVVLRGEIYGRISMPRNRLCIEQNGRAGLSVEVQEAEVWGSVLGELRAARVILRNGSRFSGNICSSNLVIEDGAYCSARVERA